MDRKRIRMCSALLLGILLTCNALAAQDDDPITLDTDPNLAAWWKFDETSGKTAADASKHERVATFRAELSFDRNSAAGRTGTAVRLDGEEGYLTVPEYKGIGGTRPGSRRRQHPGRSSPGAPSTSARCGRWASSAVASASRPTAGICT